MILEEHLQKFIVRTSFSTHLSLFVRNFLKLFLFETSLMENKKVLYFAGGKVIDMILHYFFGL